MPQISHRSMGRTPYQGHYNVVVVVVDGDVVVVVDI